MQMVHQLGAAQNMGWLDRVIRFVLGFALIAVLLLDIYQDVTLGWHAYLPIIAIYPLLTAFIGWDPFYAVSHVKSCDTSPRNRCGTFPFEIESALGRKVECNSGYDCSISGDEHRKHQKEE